MREGTAPAADAPHSPPALSFPARVQYAFWSHETISGGNDHTDRYPAGLTADERDCATGGSGWL